MSMTRADGPERRFALEAGSGTTRSSGPSPRERARTLEAKSSGAAWLQVGQVGRLAVRKTHDLAALSGRPRAHQADDLPRAVAEVEDGEDAMLEAGSGAHDEVRGAATRRGDR